MTKGVIREAKEVRSKLCACLGKSDGGEEWLEACAKSRV